MGIQGLVEIIRHFGWPAIGIHFVYTHAVPALFLMGVCSVAAAYFQGRTGYALRIAALLLSIGLGATFLVLTAINPTFKNSAALVFAGYVFLRNAFALHRARRRQTTGCEHG